METQEKRLDNAEIRNVFTPPEDEIRKRAYEIFLARGGRPGSALQDWLQAESELWQARTIFL